jgi:hypothetical protein
MSAFNLFLEYLNDGYALLASLVGLLDPTSTLYGLLAGTYGTAAAAASRDDHHLLARCYVASALLHGLIGVCHHLHL